MDTQNKERTKSADNTLANLADGLVVKTNRLIKQAKNEEDLKIGFEKILEPVLKDLGIKPIPKYEKSIFNAGRSDALHGQVVIEYEPPKAFRSQRAISHAFDQLVGYLQGLSQKEKNTLFIFESKFIGVGFDGERVFFARYQGDKEKAKSELDKKDFILIGPYNFNQNSARTLLTHLRALAKLPLTAENLADKFGPDSALAEQAVSAFADCLKHWGIERVKVFFNEWKRLFGIVYGEQFTDGHQEKEAKALSKLYKVRAEIDFQELLFSVHTYFAFLMKLIVAELLTLRETALTSSFASKLTHFSEEELKIKLEDIEDGGVYAHRGITNFLEGDFFRWYLEAWSPRLKEAIQEVARALSEFEPATSTIAPEATRDLLKKLYQYLVPQEVRHRLGEYYTPDWLAELLLNEVGYDGNNFKKLLDPACGSGTFLVLAIQRAKEWGRKNKRPPLEIAKSIKANIWGFDLNPLAVLAARTNYLLALGHLANELESFEIPIYLADSVLWPERKGQMILKPKGESIEVQTSVAPFFVPKIWVKEDELQEEIFGYKRLISKAAPLIESMVKNEYSVEEAMEQFKKEALVFPPHENIVSSFYKQILDLEKQHKNGIWARFLKNAFAPMIAGEKKFDFVVGNPPWIMWQYLSKEYREATQKLWENYGLTRIQQTRNVLIRGRRDFSMLFTYASADYYLREGAKLGFLITQEVFKSKGAGEGFRRFQLGDKKYLKVLKAHDLVSVQPFEGVTNKTAAIILKKGEKTEYPVSYIVWNKKKGVGKIATDKLLDEVLPLLQRKKYIANPISSNIGTWRTVLVESERISRIEGRNYYKANIGVVVSPYGVFWLNIKSVLSNNDLNIENLYDGGKIKVPKIEAVIEHDLVYPAVRSRDIQRWISNPQTYILITHPASQIPYDEESMKREWPKTYNYLLNFRSVLLQMALYKHFHEPVGGPFYGQRNIGQHVFSNHKVVWKRQASELIACVVSQHKTPFGYKTIIPLDPSALITSNSGSEAHYLCAIINSNPVRDFIKSFSSAGRGFGTPSVMEHVGIPKFDPKNPLHQKLAEISKKCHQLKAEGKEKEVEKLEKENDNLIKDLFRIK